MQTTTQPHARALPPGYTAQAIRDGRHSADFRTICEGCGR